MSKHKILWIVLFALAVLFWVWRPRSPNAAHPERPVLPQDTGTSPLPSTGIVTTGPVPVNASAAADLTNALEPHQTNGRGTVDKDQARRAAIAERSKQPLDLYGRVIDQYGQPVAAATVKADVELNPGTGYSRSEARYAETDGDGRFSFLGLHGLGLGIWPQKEGYDYDLKLPSKRPDNYQADPNNPLVFRMWKRRGPEPLIHTSFDARVRYDGGSATFNLASGKREADGDLRITLLRQPLQIKRGRDRYDWKVRIEVAGGGLLAEDDPYPNWAPENGYRPFFEVAMRSNSIPWIASLTQSFYFRNARAQYGRLLIGLSSDSERPDTGISVQTWVNPSGSQNLELDPAKQVR